MTKRSHSVLCVFLLLLLPSFLFLPMLTSAANQRLDVCATKTEEERLTWRHLHEGVFVDISTGENAGVEPSRLGKAPSLLTGAAREWLADLPI